jgi:hypothetical protein
MTRTKTGGHPDMKLVNPGAAAVDIGSTMHMAAVNPDICDTPPCARSAPSLRICTTLQRGSGHAG